MNTSAEKLNEGENAMLYKENQGKVKTACSSFLNIFPNITLSYKHSPPMCITTGPLANDLVHVFHGDQRQVDTFAKCDLMEFSCAQNLTLTLSN